MAARTILQSDLCGLPDADLERIAAEFAADRQGPLDGELADLDSRIAAFETRYEMSSATMRQLFADCQIRETADICAWITLLNLRDRLVR